MEQARIEHAPMELLTYITIAEVMDHSPTVVGINVAAHTDHFANAFLCGYRGKNNTKYRVS